MVPIIRFLLNHQVQGTLQIVSLNRFPLAPLSLVHSMLCSSAAFAGKENPFLAMGKANSHSNLADSQVCMGNRGGKPISYEPAHKIIQLLIKLQAPPFGGPFLIISSSPSGKGTVRTWQSQCVHLLSLPPHTISRWQWATINSRQLEVKEVKSQTGRQSGG